MYVIAEAGVNHNGSEELAMELIDVAAKAGAQAVKFQTFKAEKLVAKGTATAKYQQQQTGNTDQFAMLKGLELQESAYPRLIEHCNRLGIEFLSTPFDIESAHFLVDLGMNKIKVPSGELTNIPFIKQLASFDLPLILSTGMADMDEVNDAVNVIKQARIELGFVTPLSQMLTILHCTSNYPAADENVNLSAITTLKNSFDVPIGYSDHTEGIVVSVAAAALGAVVLEKHFTTDCNLPGPDHKASIEAGALAELVAQAQRVARCLGTGVKQPTKSELPIKKLVRRSIVAATDLRTGHCITKDDLMLLRPGTGIAPKEFEAVVGRVLNTNIAAGDLLTWDDLSNA